MGKLISQQAAIDVIKKRLFETAFNNVGIKQNVDETLVDVAENRLENWFDEISSAQSDTTTHDSIPAKTGENDGDGTSGDCISRAQAIDALRDFLVEKRCPDDGTLTCRLIENEVINKLPSIQPEQPWIPVTEILPENDDKVLITHSHGVSMAWWNGRYWTGSMIKKYKTVTAWMPLPEPYQEGGKQ